MIFITQKCLGFPSFVIWLTEENVLLHCSQITKFTPEPWKRHKIKCNANKHLKTWKKTNKKVQTECTKKLEKTFFLSKFCKFPHLQDIKVHGSKTFCRIWNALFHSHTNPLNSDVSKTFQFCMVSDITGYQAHSEI